MVYAGAKVEGAARLRRSLGKAGADMAELTATNKKAAGIVADRARQKAPVGPDFGGHIRDTVRAGATRKTAVVRVGNKRMPYGNPQHWGWPARNIAANPWVSEAAQETESQWVDVYYGGLVQIINSIEGA